ncbi:YadA-like family protein [Megasphaera elsdenii]|uniref:YadA-like family protein n=1 Tax=Megasphaera elsdenii TaxID=907 RepID=UPI0024304020|nr:YadA-like family protein [Megasphaera elsdenii]
MYWVRDGYTIKYEADKRYPDARNANIIKAYKTSSYTADSDAGLLKSNQIMVESAGISTLTGVDLDDVSGGTYVGATNSGSTSTPSSFNYMIKDDNGTYVDAGKTNFSKRFKAAMKNTDGTYSYKGEVIANDNLYVVDNKVGVFLTSGGKVYTGKVFGANNEVLMTTKSDSGTMYSYWGADTPDPNTKLADMTIGQFNQALEKVNNNSKAVAGDTIKEIKTTAKTDGGGTIDLVRRGQYNSATGQYEGEHKVGSGITITSHGGTNGEDVKINFSNGTTGFDVAAGSKVEAIKATESTTDITTDITGLKINGKTYNIKTGQTYTAGDNISINGNEISATDTDTTYTAGDNVSISNDNKISATNTTLVAGEAEKKDDSYIVKDTAGNEVTLEDVASASKLTEVNNQVTENTQNITKNTQNITKNTTNITELGEKLKGAVMYDSTATGFDKNNVTLGGTTYDSEKKTGGTKITNLARGTNDSDAVNFSQLKEVQDAENYVISGSLSRTDGIITLNRLNDGPVTISGLQDYVKGIDSYVTNATLSGDTLTLSRNQGLEALTVDLSSLTAKMSGTDYRVVENPAEGSDGIYKPNDKGNIELTVEDVKSGKTTTIQLSDIASVTTVDSKITNTTQTITNEYTTAITNAKTEIEEKIEGAKVHYYSVNPDSISGKDNYDNDGAVGVDSIAVGASAYADGRLGAAAFGNRSNANGERALAVGYGAKAEGMDTIAIGSSNNGSKGAKGTNSIAIGAQADANGTKTIFRGKEYTGTWGNATALGAYTEAGAGATALGASSKARGFNATAVGIRAEASAANSVALGNASSALREADAKGAYDYVGYSAGAALSVGERDSAVWHANLGAVSIGNESFATGETDEDGNLLHFQYTRQLTNLAAGTADTDAVNVAQLKKSRVELTDGTHTTVNSTNDENDGHVIYSVDVKTNGTINEGDTNIVTGDTVYNALQNVSWKAKVNGNDAKTVAKDGTLNFIDGDNIAITSTADGDIKISTTGLASSGDLWTAQAGGTDVKVVNKKVNFVGSDHITVTGTDGQIKFEATGLADTDLTNITEGGKTVINNLAKEAVKVVDGTNTNVETVPTTDGHAEYKVNLNEDVKLGDTIQLNGSDGSISAKSGGAKLSFNNNGLTVSQAKNGVTNETRINGAEITVDGGIGNQTTIKGSMARIGSVLVNGGSGTATITGLTNKTTNYTGFANGSGRAATEEQLKEVDSKAAAAKTTVTNGKNITVDEAKADDGSSTYTVGLATDVVLGDNAIKLNGSDGSISAKSGGAKLSFNNNGLTVSQAKNGLTNETRINGAEITVDGGIGNQTTIKGSMARIGSVLVNGGSGTATITGLTNKTTNYTGFANGSGRAATEEQLKEVDSKAAAAKTTVTNGKNITVDEAKADDGSSTYTVGLATDVVLGDNAIKLNGSDGSISAKSGGAKLSFNNNGLTVSQAKNGLTNETRIDGATITVDGGAGNQTIINGSTARIGSVLVNGGSGTATISGLTNQTTKYDGFANGSGRAATEEQLKEVDSKAAAAKTTVINGKNITVNKAKAADGSSTYTVGLETDVVLGDNAIKLNGSDGSISAKSGGAQLAFNNSGLTVSQAKNGLTNETRINGAEITVDGGIGNQTTIKGSTARIGSVLVNGGSGTATISGLTNQTTKYDGFANGSGRAATEEQLKEVAGKAGEAIETAGKGWNLTTNKGTATNIAPGGTVDFSSGNDNLVISNAGADLSFSLSDNLDLTKNDSKKGSVKVGENTALSNELLQVGNSSLTTSALMVGGLTYISSSGLNANNRVISNVKAGVLGTDAVNVDQLNSTIKNSQISIKAGDGISVAKTGNQYTINVNIEGVTNNQGKVTVSTGDSTSTESGSESGSSGAKKFRVMDLMYRAEVNEIAPETTTDTGKAIQIENIPENIKLEADDNQAASVVNGETIKIAGDGKNISTKANVTGAGSMDTISVSLKPDIQVDSVTINNGGPTINNTGIDMNNHKITKLAEGDISAKSTDAVNGSQLYATNQRVTANTENINNLTQTVNNNTESINTLNQTVDNHTENINILNEAVTANAENINSLSHSLNKLDSRINRVGAGAAALAALHPLDFDPDNKWDFAAGYGNYAGANAVAIGTYYRPNENTMFSIGGSFGGGENMINAGVSFKLGSGGSGITTSKTVMAKKIKEQDELLKAQDAKMKEQDEKIAKLEALVAQQGEMIQQALGKK